MVGEVRPDKTLRVLSSEFPHDTMILRIKAKEATFLAQYQHWGTRRLVSSYFDSLGSQNTIEVVEDILGELCLLKAIEGDIPKWVVMWHQNLQI